MASRFARLALLAAAASPAQAAIAAWWNNYGTQIMLLNETTGQIRYSACNAYDTPKYSPTDGSVLSLDIKPKNNTALAGAGYWTTVTTVASIYYVEERGNIANAVFNCNMTTGRFQSAGNWIISNDAPSIHGNTGLSVVLLNELGYRLYYHTQKGEIASLKYTQEDNWSYDGIVSKDVNVVPAIGSTFSNKQNVSVVTPRDDQSIAISRWNTDETYWRATLPRALRGNITTSNTNRSDIAVNATAPANFTLAAWDGKTRSIGISVDSAYTRSVWYIGTDRALHGVYNKNWFWSQYDNQSDVIWPLADTANGEMAVASDFRSNMTRIYYMVNSQLAEIKYENNVWKQWAPVPTPSPITSTPAPPASSGDASADASGSDSGLSTGAKIGIGVGVSLGIIAIAAIIAALILMRRRGDDENNEANYPPEGASTTIVPETPVPAYGSPGSSTAAALRPESAAFDMHMWDRKNGATPQYVPPDYQVHQLDAPVRPTELHVPQPMYELPNQGSSHELAVENGPRPSAEYQQPTAVPDPYQPQPQQYQPSPESFQQLPQGYQQSPQGYQQVPQAYQQPSPPQPYSAYRPPNQ